MLTEVPWWWRKPSMRAVSEVPRKAAAVWVEDLQAELERVRAPLTEAVLLGRVSQLRNQAMIAASTTAER